MFPIILVFILRESVDRNDNPTSRRNMNSRNVGVTFKRADQMTRRAWRRLSSRIALAQFLQDELHLIDGHAS